MIRIISEKNAEPIGSSLDMNRKNPWAVILPELPPDYESKNDDQIYIDISGLSPASLKKAIGEAKKSGGFWGIIDAKGIAADPASFFFEGAGDYIGREALNNGLDKKRFQTALSWFRKITNRQGAHSSSDYGVKRKKHKLPAGEFEGWKSIPTGTLGSFFFLFVSLAGESNLRSLIGETAFGNVKMRLRETLEHNLRESGALLWMENESNSLFLIPPKSSNCKTAIEAALKMILNSKLIGIEKLGLLIPVEFIFALHYGQTIFQAPGKTGAIISESVNYIFHLGAKRAEAGRLTISDDVPEDPVLDDFRDLFIPAGIFEGIPIRQSKRFICT